MEEVLLLLVEDFLDVEEWWLMYVVLIWVCYWVWVLFNKENFFFFVEILKNLDVLVVRKL